VVGSHMHWSKVEMTVKSVVKIVHIMHGHHGTWTMPFGMVITTTISTTMSITVIIIMAPVLSMAVIMM
jgi:hypothetical protein